MTRLRLEHAVLGGSVLVPFTYFHVGTFTTLPEGKKKKKTSVRLAPAESAHMILMKSEIKHALIVLVLSNILVFRSASGASALGVPARHVTVSRTLIGAASAGSAGGCGGVSWLHSEWIARGDAGFEETDLPSG